MAEQKLTFKFEEKGLDAVNADLNKIQSELKETGQAATAMGSTVGAATNKLSNSIGGATNSIGQLGAATRGTVINSQMATQGFGSMAGVVGNLGSVAGQTSPAIGRLGGVIGTAGAAATTAFSVFGPWGALIAGIGVALAAVIPMIIEMTEETDELAKATERSTRSIADHLSMIRQRNSERILNARARSSDASVEESEAALRNARDEETAAKRRVRTLRRFRDDQRGTHRIQERAQAEIELRRAIDLQDAAINFVSESEERLRIIRRDAIVDTRLQAENEAELAEQRRIISEAEGEGRIGPSPETQTSTGSSREADPTSSIRAASAALEVLNERTFTFTDNTAAELMVIDESMSDLAETAAALVSQGAGLSGGIAGLLGIDAEATQEAQDNITAIRSELNVLETERSKLDELRNRLADTSSANEAVRIRAQINDIKEELDVRQAAVRAEIDLLKEKEEAFRRTSEFVADQIARDNSIFAASAETQRRINERANRERLQSYQRTVMEIQNAETALADVQIQNLDGVIDAWNRLNEAMGTAAQTAPIMLDSVMSVMAQVGDVVEQSFRGAATAAIDEFIDSMWEMQEQAELAAERTSDSLDETGKAAETSAVTMGEAFESLIRSVVQSLVVEAAIQTVVETAKAVSSAASLDPVGAAAHAGAAAAWAVVTGAAGVALGAMGPGPRAGGVRASRPSESEQRDQQENDNKGETIITINFQGDAFATRDDIGRAVQQAIEEAQRSGAL